MRFSIGAVVVLLLSLAPLQAEDNKTPRDRFLALNPNYAKRSGDFYRREYLPSAAQALTGTIDQAAFKRADAERVLTALIDGFLEKWVDGGGAITRPEHARLMAAMDKSVGAIVKDKGAFARYVRWRSNTDGKVNALTFLMTLD